MTFLFLIKQLYTLYSKCSFNTKGLGTITSEYITRRFPQVEVTRLQTTAVPNICIS